ncbi:MAG: YccF domain-containing protein, partial [Anaeroplasmataceae bacterium]
MINLIANILWIIFGGLISAIACFIGGVVLCITIIGIPFGLQAFKLGKLSLAPFGKEVNTNFDKHPIINVIWAVLFGVWIA